jgi:hypothetical protein
MQPNQHNNQKYIPTIQKTKPKSTFIGSDIIIDKSSVPVHSSDQPPEL